MITEVDFVLIYKSYDRIYDCNCLVMASCGLKILQHFMIELTTTISLVAVTANRMRSYSHNFITQMWHIYMLCFDCWTNFSPRLCFQYKRNGNMLSFAPYSASVNALLIITPCLYILGNYFYVNESVYGFICKFYSSRSSRYKECFLFCHAHTLHVYISM